MCWVEKAEVLEGGARGHLGSEAIPRRRGGGPDPGGSGDGFHTHPSPRARGIPVRRGGLHRLDGNYLHRCCIPQGGADDNRPGYRGSSLAPPLQSPSRKRL